MIINKRSLRKSLGDKGTKYNLANFEAELN